MAGTTAAGTMIIATMTARTTIAVPGAEKAVAKAMAIGTENRLKAILHFGGFAPAQRRGPHLRLSSGVYGPSLLFSPFHPTG